MSFLPFSIGMGATSFLSNIVSGYEKRKAAKNWNKEIEQSIDELRRLANKSLNIGIGERQSLLNRMETADARRLEAFANIYGGISRGTRQETERLFLAQQDLKLKKVAVPSEFSIWTDALTQGSLDGLFTYFGLKE